MRQKLIIGWHHIFNKLTQNNLVPKMNPKRVKKMSNQNMMWSTLAPSNSLRPQCSISIKQSLRRSTKEVVVVEAGRQQPKVCPQTVKTNFPA